MAVKVLNQEEKDWVIDKFVNKLFTIPEIAKELHVSTRTVNRVLEEARILTKRQQNHDDAFKIRKILSKHNIISIKDLDRILADYVSRQAALDLRDKQTMNLESVQQFLNAASKEQLAALFFTAGLCKIAEMHVGSVTNSTLRHQQAAQKGNIHYGQTPFYRQG